MIESKQIALKYKGKRAFKIIYMQEFYFHLKKYKLIHLALRTFQSKKATMTTLAKSQLQQSPD